MLSYHKEGKHGSATWKDAEDVYRWWLYGNPPKEIQVTGQIELSIERELGNIVKEIEKKKPEPSKSGKMFFKRNCMTGKDIPVWNRRKPNHRRRSIKPNQKGTGASL